jgi:NOL1/NOP2/sun family putative RNA methylase
MTKKSPPAIPPAFIDRMERLLGDGSTTFLEALEGSPQSGLRVNTLKLNPARFLELVDFDLTPLPWSPEGFSLPTDHDTGKHPYHAAGLYYLQDPSAMAVAAALDPQPGEKILDLAAAPGGKATHICALMQNRGLLVANDIHHRRVMDLSDNLERWGARNVAITSESPERLCEYFSAFFDRVLVDAPCSGEGLFRKNPSSRLEWSPAGVQQCAVRQHNILGQAVRLVRPGGVLAYSTCTFSPEENEQVVAWLLKENPDYHLLQPAVRTGFERGRPEWLSPGRIQTEVSRATRLWPHHAPGEGHFFALFQRQDAAVSKPPPAARPSLPQRVRSTFEDFLKDSLVEELDTTRLTLVGSYLYWLPETATSLNGLRVIHPGWWLGSIRKGRFEPSRWLAMGLAFNQTNRRANFAAQDPDLVTYLRGGSQPDSGEPGWITVGVDGFPIGWARRNNGLLKSQYPHRLRLR